MAQIVPNSCLTEYLDSQRTQLIRTTVFMSLKSVSHRHGSHKDLLLEYRWYGELRCEESQVLKSVGRIGTASFTAYHQKRADEHKTTYGTASTNNDNTHTHRQIITDDLSLSRLGLSSRGQCTVLARERHSRVWTC